MNKYKARLNNDENKFEVVDMANKVYKQTVKLCVKLPKRYTYLVTQKVVDTAFDVMANAKTANSIFPINHHEAQIRRDYWLIARAKLQALSSSIDYFLAEPDILTYKDETTGKVKRITINET